MGLLGEIQQQVRHHGTACSVGVAAAKMNAKDRDELNTALADSSIPGTAICRALKARGLAVNDGAINRHRKGECACGKS